MDIDKQLEALDKELTKLLSCYSQSNPVQVLEIRYLKREITRLEKLKATLQPTLKN
jgi:uncharacterized coiled-coil DUF342 family protein